MTIKAIAVCVALCGIGTGLAADSAAPVMNMEAADVVKHSMPDSQGSMGLLVPIIIMVLLVAIAAGGGSGSHHYYPSSY